jgi:hypothetical protein
LDADHDMAEITVSIKPRSPVNAFVRHRCELLHIDSQHVELQRHGVRALSGRHPMHSRFNRSRRKEDGFFEKRGFGFLVLPLVLAVTMVVLWFVQPKTNLIADIVEKEFTGHRALPGEAPTQMAKPEMGMRTAGKK